MTRTYNFGNGIQYGGDGFVEASKTTLGPPPQEHRALLQPLASRFLVIIVARGRGSPISECNRCSN